MRTTMEEAAQIIDDLRYQFENEEVLAEKRKNDKFTQVSNDGWRALMEMIPAGGAKARLFCLLAATADTTGAVVATQDDLATILGVSVKTISRAASELEAERKLARIRLGSGGGAYAYALNPDLIWKSYATTRGAAAFAVRAITTKSKGDEFKKRMVALLQPDLLGIARAEKAREKRAPE